jgi:oxygen-dependent protoporphyrinogen oxidase
MFVSLRSGMTSLVETIANGLSADTVRLNTRVQSVTRGESQWQLRIEGQEATVSCDKLVVATPAPKAADLLKSCDAQLAADLGKIEYAGCAVVCLGYGKNQLPRPLDGFGFVVPSIEQRRLLSASYASEKFDGRAPDDAVLIRVFIGGAVQQELMQVDDDELRSIACDELKDLIGVRGDPRVCHIARWEGTMPQYHVGHVELVQGIERRVRELKDLAVTGNAYYGVGVPHCVHRAEQAVERLLNQADAD